MLVPKDPKKLICTLTASTPRNKHVGCPPPLGGLIARTEASLLTPPRRASSPQKQNEKRLRRGANRVP
ncbi:hypothetical protein PgNI_05978 [Pyricularia grisea]|uniref:Uncharacterized protein n=1 Tax=Pyricularia grisea TaxID=148305 RepID=A0A6P8B762_PYRGI|nr:hypothetical protein PgNI_05978 [Pyricularia grisea]TLD10969.1 hypothetical protein PgNI_05978 [Pyricularia grisea]